MELSHEFFFVLMEFSEVESSRKVKINHWLLGRERSLACMSPLLCARRVLGHFLIHLICTVTLKRKWYFLCFPRWGSVRLLGCPSSESKGVVERDEEWSSVPRQTCLSGIVLCSLANEKGSRRAGEWVPAGACFYPCPEIGPVTHSCRPLLSATSQGAFLIFLSRLMTSYMAPPLCGSF